MPDKPLTVITYAASASLAAIALVYFFNPNYLIDNGPGSNSASTRKKGVVGLSNPLNDCFINSVLQALAGLGDLRIYLIRELHRRKLSDPQVYRILPEEEEGKPINRRKLLGLQSGDVTQGLKVILDQLNERPIQRKIVTARPFILTLERAFDTRISRDQQDAQELLQVVAERVCDEYHAGRDARKRARKDMRRKSSTAPITDAAGLGLSVEAQSKQRIPSIAASELEGNEDDLGDEEEEAGFPLEGETESQVECQHSHFVPKSTPISFVMLTLSVPQKTSATLNECFDAHFKSETIDDYKCDRCRLEHAISVYQKELSKASSREAYEEIQEAISRLEEAVATDPEKPPPNIRLPDSKHAPTRKIERHVKITKFPQILVIHLSRSIFDVRSSSAKNTAKVTFPEQLPLGGLIDRRNYKLLGVITHKGTHNSGHYECFRRQHVYAPFSTPHVDPETGPYSRAQTPTQNPVPSPQISSQTQTPTISPFGSKERVSQLRGSEDQMEPTSTSSSSSPSLLSDRPSSASTRPSSASLANGTLSPPPLTPKRGSLSNSTLGASSPSRPASATATAVDEDSQTTRRDSAATATSLAKSLVDKSGLRRGRKKKPNDRWWRISDDKIKECRTAEVLDMQREVYLLFYEMER